jgi:hypothetical protein
MPEETVDWQELLADKEKMEHQYGSAVIRENTD